jgi:gas vesicle protein
MMNKSTYYLVGFGCGSLAGLLLAPKPGAAMRTGIVKAGKKQRRIFRQKVASAADAIANWKVGAMRAIKRGMPAKRVRALFQ